MTALTDQEKAVLDFAARWWRYRGAQEEAMTVELGLSSTRFWQIVNTLIDRQEALAYAPTTVHRLRRERAIKLRARSARTRGLSVGERSA
ncbi:MAG: DUF3263 domain-containing protein [Actinomycetota bacterium]|nr:DUF3263 domain-containing protein [Actinomycetota bacterium]